jgi:hypothetical protein
MPENTLRSPTGDARFLCGWSGPRDGLGKVGCGHEYVAKLPPFFEVRLPRCPKCGRWRAGLVNMLSSVAG